ncbi:MAG: cobalamin-dependent protein, partial [Candidatus Margulisiibacteriota bacterium]
MSNSRIAFYNPIPHQLVKGTGEIFRPPMALIGLAHVARRQGAEVVIVNGLHYEDADVQAQLKAFAPTHLCVSTYHQPNYVKRELAAMAPFRGKIPIIVGGHEASAWPEGVRSSLRPDFLFMGEGEVALEEFIRSGFRPDAMSAELATAENANGIWQIQGKKRFNLDELPLPTEITGFFRTPNKEMDWEQANINIARGCVGHCIYCGGAKKGLGHMSAHRVVEQMHAWKNLGFSYFDFLAADASSHPKKATQIAQAITQDGSFRGDGIYFFARGDTFVHALDLKLDDGTPGIEIWRAFLKMHAVEIETGLETTVLKRLLPAHFRKYPTQEAAAQHVDHFARICELARETGSKIATDLLSFDPDSTLR